MTQEEKAFRQRLVDQMHSGQKTLVQIQQELADYQNPDAAELRRFRERELFVQAVLDEFNAWNNAKSALEAVQARSRMRNDLFVLRDFKITP